MFRLICVALALVGFVAPLQAQTYPVKPIRMIVPFPPGGGTDISSRLVAAELAKSTGWTIVVENKAGASGMIGLAEAARASPEGYDIVMGQADNVIIAAPTMKSPPLDPLKDLTPVIQVASSPSLIMTRVDSPYKTLADAVAASKTGGAPITYGTAGHGTFPQLAVDLLMQNGNFKWTEVPYKGASPAITDMLGGHVQLAALSVASGIPHIKGGKVRGLAVTSPTRSAALPDVPTAAELGFAGFDIATVIGLQAPAGLPRDIAARLQAAVAKALREPDLAERMANLGMDLRENGTESYARFVREDIERYTAAVRTAGIKNE